MRNENEPARKDAESPSIFLNALCFFIPFAALISPILFWVFEPDERNPLSWLLGFVLNPYSYALQILSTLFIPLILISRSSSTSRVKSAAKSTLAGCGCNFFGLLATAIFIATTFQGCC